MLTKKVLFRYVIRSLTKKADNFLKPFLNCTISFSLPFPGFVNECYISSSGTFLVSSATSSTSRSSTSSELDDMCSFSVWNFLDKTEKQMSSSVQKKSPKFGYCHRRRYSKAGSSVGFYFCRKFTTPPLPERIPYNPPFVKIIVSFLSMLNF